MAPKEKGHPNFSQSPTVSATQETLEAGVAWPELRAGHPLGFSTCQWHAGLARCSCWPAGNCDPLESFSQSHRARRLSSWDSHPMLSPDHAQVLPPPTSPCTPKVSQIFHCPPPKLPTLHQAQLSGTPPPQGVNKGESDIAQTKEQKLGWGPWEKVLGQGLANYEAGKSQKKRRRRAFPYLAASQER